MKKSTYSMLVRSEEKGRSAFETVIAGLFILSAVFSIFQAAQQSFDLPSDVTPASYLAKVDRDVPLRG